MEANGETTSPVPANTGTAPMPPSTSSVSVNLLSPSLSTTVATQNSIANKNRKVATKSIHLKSPSTPVVQQPEQIPLSMGFLTNGSAAADAAAGTGSRTAAAAVHPNNPEEEEENYNEEEDVDEDEENFYDAEDDVVQAEVVMENPDDATAQQQQQEQQQQQQTFTSITKATPTEKQIKKKTVYSVSRRSSIKRVTAAKSVTKTATKRRKTVVKKSTKVTTKTKVTSRKKDEDTDNVDDEKFWEIDQILDVRVVGRSKQYLVKWVGDQYEPTWEPQKNLNASALQDAKELFRMKQQHQLQLQQSVVIPDPAATTFVSSSISELEPAPSIVPPIPPMEEAVVATITTTERNDAAADHEMSEA